MDIVLLTGIVGGCMLVLGAAWQEQNVKNNPLHSVKDWLLFIGGVILLIYAILGFFLQHSSPFFIFLELLTLVASILMMLNTDDRFDTIFLSLLGLGFIAWSLSLSLSIDTVWFIVGLTGIAVGYALTPGWKRDLAFTLGSTCVCIFSFLVGSWVFFWLNVFFALFSLFWLLRSFTKKA